MINRLSLFTLLTLTLASRSFAAIPFTIGGNYNSGVNPYTNLQLAAGSADLLFNLYTFSPAPFVGTATVVPTADNGPGWVTSSPAQWIAPIENESGAPQTGNPSGVYVYQASFAADFLAPTQVSVLGSFAADDNAQFFVNGQLAATSPANGSSGLTPIDFTFNVGAGLTILPVQFVVDNLPTNSATNPTGLLVTNLHFVTGVAPEPSTWALLLGGVGILLFVQRRRVAELL